MLTVSHAALEKFDRTISGIRESRDREPCLRLVRHSDSGLALAVDAPHDDDATFDFDGRTVLAVPNELADFCADKKLDLDDDGNLTLA